MFIYIYIYIYVILFIIVYQIISIVIGMFNMHFCIFLNRFKMFQNVSMRLSRFLSCHTALLLGPWARNNCKAQHFSEICRIKHCPPFKRFKTALPILRHDEPVHLTSQKP